MRTVLTGIGLISPFGLTKEALEEGLYSGKSAIVPLPSELKILEEMISFAAPCSAFTGHIDEFVIEDVALRKTTRKNLKIMCRETQMALASAQQAILDAGWAFHGVPQNRLGVLYGSDYMLAEPQSTAAAFRACMDEAGTFHTENFGASGVSNVMPLWLLMWLPNMPGCHISILNQLLGPNNSLTMNEASANATLRYAHETIARGIADGMLTGSTGSRLQSMRTFQVVISEKMADRNEVPEQASRPFDRNRTGQVLGEGAGTLILESLEYAQRRGAPIYAEYLSACDTMAGTHTSDLSRMALVPDHKTAFRNALKKALDLAGKTPDDIGFLMAYGLGDPEVDRAEAEAIDEVFGSRREPIPVVAPKSILGNLGGGSGSIELAAGIFALNRGVLFPTRNFEAFDDGSDYRFRVVTDSETPSGDCFLHLSTNFSGQTSAAILGRYKG